MSIINQAFADLTLQDISNANAVAELLERYGLRWSVSKNPLYLGDGTETPFFGITRDDTSKVFSSCKETYVPFQNSELSELLHMVCNKGGYAMHSGGCFNDGGKVFLQLESGNAITGIGDNSDRVTGYVTGINCHDGTGSLRWGLANITISCKNTFAQAGRELTNRARHTVGIHAKVEDYLREVGLIVEQEKVLFDRFRTLANIPSTKENIINVVKAVTGVNPDKPMTDFSAYAVNRAGQLMTSITNEMAQKGESLWGLFSGVTHYTSHVMSVPKRDNARLESKYVGGALAIDNKVLNLL